MARRGRRPLKSDTRLAQVLIQRGYTRAQLAREIQVHLSHAARIVAGKRPSPKVAERIISWSGGAVTWADLYGGEARAA